MRARVGEVLGIRRVRNVRQVDQDTPLVRSVGHHCEIPPHEVAVARPCNVGRSAASGGIPGLDLAGPAYLPRMSSLLSLDGDSSLAE
jgi:hypothetical protein